ncbi:MAG: porin, partial [Candidatus Methylophosphatis roskildensis]
MEISDMSKKIIALALAALAPAAAMAADSNVTMYGIIDYGFVSRGGNDTATNQTRGRTGSLNEFAGGIS